MPDPQRPDQPTAVDQFLNPTSMLTPGVCGSMVMMISNTLFVQFNLQPRFTGLILSFLLGLVVFVFQKTAEVKSFVLYVLNSLVIFTMAVGTNSLGSKVTAQVGQWRIPQVVSSSYAQGYESPAQDTSGTISRPASTAVVQSNTLTIVTNTVPLCLHGKPVLDTNGKPRMTTVLVTNPPPVATPAANMMQQRPFFNQQW